MPLMCLKDLKRYTIPMLTMSSCKTVWHHVTLSLKLIFPHANINICFDCSENFSNIGYFFYFSIISIKCDRLICHRHLVF